MPITDYFLAPDDPAAVAVIDVFGPAAAGRPTVPAKNIDPVVNLGHLESYLTGRTYDEVTGTEGHGRPASGPADNPDAFVITVTDTLRDALAAATPEQITEAAGKWAQTEELDGSDPVDLADFITRLAELARAGDGHLYCFWSL